MDFLSTLQWNARRRFPDTAKSRLDRYATPLDHPLAVFLLAIALLFALTQWLLANGYLDENALSIWAKILALRDAQEARLEYLGFGYAHGPIYLTMLASLLPGLSAPILPYQLSAIFAALVLAYCYRLIRPHMPVWVAWIGIVLIAVNPLFLWSATSSLQSSLGLGVFFAVCLNIMWLPVGYTPQAYLRLGTLLALLFLVDERAIYLAPGLFLLIAAALPRGVLARSPLAIYLLIFTPLALTILAWGYLNWLFLGDPWDFLRAGDSTFLGAWLDYPYTPWLIGNGGKFLQPALLALAMQLAAFPAVLILGWRAIGRSWPLRTGLIVYGTLALAVGLSTLHGTLAHPAVYISLTTAGLAVGFHHLRPREQRHAPAGVHHTRARHCRGVGGPQLATDDTHRALDQRGPREGAAGALRSRASTCPLVAQPPGADAARRSRWLRGHCGSRQYPRADAALLFGVQARLATRTARCDTSRRAGSRPQPWLEPAAGEVSQSVCEGHGGI